MKLVKHGAHWGGDWVDLNPNALSILNMTGRGR